MFTCTGNELRVTVQAGNAKNRKCESVLLWPELAKDLKEYFESKLALPSTKAFLGIRKNLAAMIKEDLELAGIEYQTDDGVCDFHALCHTFGAMLARSGVTPQIAQKLMRHADYNTTLKYYTHLLHGDKTKALDKLPSMLPNRQQAVKTGTCDVPEKSTLNSTKNYVKIERNTIKSRICDAGRLKRCG